ncbi:hypothetical protein, partial [Burkholderia sp. LMG 13014]
KMAYDSVRAAGSTRANLRRAKATEMSGMVTDRVADMTLTAMVAESVARCRTVAESDSAGRF